MCLHSDVYQDNLRLVGKTFRHEHEPEAESTIITLPSYSTLQNCELLPLLVTGEKAA